MAESYEQPLAVSSARYEHVFPTLTPAQMARVEVHGCVRAVHAGDVLVHAGDAAVHFFLVKSGLIEIVRPGGPSGEMVVATQAPGQFTGEVNMISGRRAMFTIRARETG